MNRMKLTRRVLLGHAFVLMFLLPAPAIQAAALTITTGTMLPGATKGSAYATALLATGGTTPYAWTIPGYTVAPPGLSLSTGGILSGIPTTIGTFDFVAQVADAAGTSVIAVFEVKVSSAAEALAITTDSRLPTAMVGTSYSQTLTASGGSTPYVWALTPGSGALPPGISLSSSGVLSGTPTAQGDYFFSIRVTDALSATVQRVFSLSAGAPGPARNGVLSQVASGGGWKTSVYLVNTSTTAVPVTVKFWSNSGGALMLPLSVTQAGATHVTTDSSVSATVARNSTLLIESDSGASVGSAGWAEVISTGPITGYGVFHFTSSGGIESEGTVPLETSFEPSFILPYDGTDGFVTGVALTNLMTAQITSVVATVWDMNGKQLATKTINLPRSGHNSFMLADTFPSTIANRGIIEFNATGNVSGLGLRVSPAGGFTSVPNLHRP
jgi:hypothetical protein